MHSRKGYILSDKNNFRKDTEQLTHRLAFCEMWAFEKLFSFELSIFCLEVLVKVFYFGMRKHGKREFEVRKTFRRCLIHCAIRAICNLILSIKM